MIDVILDLIPQTVRTSGKNSIYLYTSSREDIAKAVADELSEWLVVYFEVTKWILAHQKNEVVADVRLKGGNRKLSEYAVNLAKDFERKYWGRVWKGEKTRTIHQYLDKIVVKEEK